VKQTAECPSGLLSEQPRHFNVKHSQVAETEVGGSAMGKFRGWSRFLMNRNFLQMKKLQFYAHQLHLSPKKICSRKNGVGQSFYFFANTRETRHSFQPHEISQRDLR
jgi:hypothetical protein